MNKLSPVPKRKTTLAWVLVLGLAVLCIGFSLFLENSKIFGAAENSSWCNNLSELGYQGTGCVPTGKIITTPGGTTSPGTGDDTTQEPCSSVREQIKTDVTKLGERARGFEISADDVDKLTNQELLSQLKSIGSPDSETLQGDISSLEKCLGQQTQCSDACATVSQKLESAKSGNDTTSISFWQNIDSKCKSNATPTEISQILINKGTGSPDPTYNSLAARFKSCAGGQTTTQGTCKNEELALQQALGYQGSDGNVVTAVDETKDKNRYKEFVDNSKGTGSYNKNNAAYEAWIKCVNQQTTETGLQPPENAPATGNIIDTSTYRWLAIMNLLSSIASGDYPSALAAAAALFGTEKTMQMYAAAGGNPEMLYGLALNELANGESSTTGWSRLVGPNGTGGNNNGLFDTNYLQRRAQQMATDLWKLDIFKGILSSAGNLVTLFMGDEEGSKFQEKWDGALDNVFEIVTGATMLKYADIAAFTNSYMGSNYSNYDWLNGGYNGYTYNAETGTYYDPQTGRSYYTDGTEYTGDVTIPGVYNQQAARSLVNLIPAGNNTFYVMARGSLSALDTQLQRVVGMVFPTARGIFFLDQYNNLYQYIGKAQSGNAIQRIINSQTQSTSGSNVPL